MSTTSRLKRSRRKVRYGSPSSMGPASAFESIVRGQTALTFAAGPETAELIWNVPKRSAITHGDILKEDVDGLMIGAIADRVRLLTHLRALGQGRALSIKVGEAGKAFVPPDRVEVGVTGLAEQC